MEDPVVGGYTPEKIALRRAIIMGFNTPDLIKVWYQGQALRGDAADSAGRRAATSPGFDVHAPYDPATARALLDKFGYKDRDGDGLRELPDGKPFTLIDGLAADGPRARARRAVEEEPERRSAIRIDFVKQKWPDLLKMATRRKAADVAGRLDHDVRRGRRVHAASLRPEHRRSRTMRASQCRVRRALSQDASACRDGPERDALYARWPRSSRPTTRWDLGVYRVENTLVRPWVLGYKKHVYFEHAWKYLDLDLARRKQEGPGTCGRTNAVR